MGFLRDLWTLTGWDGLSLAERELAVYGAAGGLALALVGRALFGGRGGRR
jgi:hypothetical protein